MKPYKYMTKQELVDAWRDVERRRQYDDDFVATYASDDRASDMYSYDDCLDARRSEAHLAKIVGRIQSEIESRWGVCIDSIMYAPEKDWTPAEREFMKGVSLEETIK